MRYIPIVLHASDQNSLSNKQLPDQDLPPLPTGGNLLLKDVEAELDRQVAVTRIDTSGYGGPFKVEGNSSTWTLRENEQSVRNWAREKLLSEQIEIVCPSPPKSRSKNSGIYV